MIKKIIVELTVLIILTGGFYYWHKKRLNVATQWGFRQGVVLGSIITKSKMCKDV